jgi:DNA-binding LacI/PurR family transcriptional regulator
VTERTAAGKGHASLRIALLAAYLQDEYEWEVLRGACEEVDAIGGKVVCFAGAGLADPEPVTAARRFVFDLVSRASVDAVLSVSSVLGHFVGSAEVGLWLARYELPVVSVGPGQAVPNVLVGDGAGIGRLVDHLVLQHGHKKIAFISGPASNAESRNRLKGYSRALDEHGLNYDTRLVVTGQFTRESGVRAVSELFDQRQVRVADVDAIVASNDYMAVGAIDELVRRRIAVPDQVAVVGFDDISPARIHCPSLTTVRQPLRELGREGVRTLLALRDGKPTERKRVLETELVLRRSCGCVPTEIPGDASEIAQERTRADALSTRLRAAETDLYYERVHKFTRALEAHLFGPTAELSTVLTEFLPSLGVHECVVAEFAPGSNRASLRVAFGFDRENVQPQRTVYPANQLMPPGFARLSTKSALVLPVCYGGESLGIAIFPATAPSGELCELLAESFGVALKSIELRRRADAKSANSDFRQK